MPYIKGQGAVSRKGAAWLKKVDALDKAGIKPPRSAPATASGAWRRASGLDDARPRPAKPRKTGFADRVLGDDDDLVVIDGSGDVRQAAAGAVNRGTRPARRAATRSGTDDGATIEDEVRAELAKVVPRQQLGKFENRLADASRAFSRERYGDAAASLKRLAADAPGVASVRELYGLTLYRQGKWKPAAKELEAFRLLTASTEQHPVLADCYRALRQWNAVDDLWAELRASSPSADLVIEGRIVTAGSRADRGEITRGIELLEQGWKLPKRPKEHHLRRAYALADLYERAGELTRARQLFEWVARNEPGFADAARRARQIGG
ncbi:MAG: hypothetical protein HYX32_03555 [Actinobacteria bacterium]|nr:hypothetical protein [Actinomycetota bacterium]